jgi:hypothetical protein
VQPSPTPDTLAQQDIVSPDVVQLFLSDLLEVADIAGASQLQVTLDMRSHPSTSLLHPGLARYQGG